MSIPSFTLSIVIPAYNEGSRIGGSLEKINDFLLNTSYSAEILVVDDGSVDDTFRTIQKFQTISAVPLRVIRFKKNRGKGAAVQKGVLEAYGDCILFSDADLSTPIAEVENLLTTMQTENADIVIGSRGLKESNITIRQNQIRQLSGKIFNILLRMITRMPFKDTQCGFKLFRRKCARDLFSELTVMDFAFDVDILYRALLKGYNIIEAPITWANSEGSRVRFFKDSFKMFAGLIRIRRAYRHLRM